MKSADATAARAAARAAYTRAGGTSPAALEAALTAYEKPLAACGVIMTGDPAVDAETAARRLAKAADSNLFRADGWLALLTESRKVWIAYNAAINNRASDPDYVRFDLVRDRDLLLGHIARNAQNA